MRQFVRVSGIGAGVLVLLLVAQGSPARGDSRGAEMYATRCAFCHGVGGAGDGVAGDALQPRPTDFTKAEYWKGVTADQVRDAIANGKPGTAMVPYGSSLKPDEIDALVTYLKSFAPTE
jgi:mono/diheme cytochrome c family protein